MGSCDALKPAPMGRRRMLACLSEISFSGVYQDLRLQR